MGESSRRGVEPARESLGEQVYVGLTRLYPRSFRERAGDDLRRAYRDRAGEARYGGGRGRLLLVAFMGFDLLRSVPAEHLHAIRRRRREGSHKGTRGRRNRAMLIEHAHDVRYALRSFGRAPGFTLACLTTLALGIGATTTIFSVVDGVLLRPLPYRDSGRLVQLGMQFGAVQAAAVSGPDFFDLQRRTRTFESLGASRLQLLDLAGTGEPERFEAVGVTAAYFDVLGVRPLLGRAFRPDEDRRGGEPVVIVSHGLWSSRFGRDRSVLGRTLTLNERAHTIVGVMPEGFQPVEALYQSDARLLFPLGQIEDDLDNRGNAFLQAIGRLRPGVTLDAARADVLEVARVLAQEYPQPPDEQGTFWVADLHARTVGDVGGRLYVLLGAVGFLLLIACANVANLFLVRATERTREISVRAALGAGRGRLAAQLLTESALMALLGGALGVALGWAGVRAFKALSPGDIPRLAEITVDLRVLAVALAVSLATGLLFGLAPVLYGMRRRLTDSLREGGHGSSVGRRPQRLRATLVIGQTAVALVLLAGAGLLVNSFVRLTRVPPGFDPENVVSLTVTLPRRYEEGEEGVLFFQRLLERTSALPGVIRAGAIHGLPLDHNQSIRTVVPEGLAIPAGERPPTISWHSTMPGYFAALGIPLIEGRDFDGGDRADGAMVAMVSETFARRFWPGERATGKRIAWAPGADAAFATVVGVAADVRHYGLALEPEPMFYVPLTQFPRGHVSFVVRHDGRDPAALLQAMRQAVWEQDPAVPLDRFGTLQSHMRTSLVEPRFYTSLLAGFAALALALAFVGLYGTLAYTVRTRSREVGIRMALGAAARDVRRMVVGQGMRLAVAGIALGTIGALVASRALRSFVFGVTPTDPLTFAVVAAAMVAVALVACWMPARRAAATDPMRTLRSD